MITTVGLVLSVFVFATALALAFRAIAEPLIASPLAWFRRLALLGTERIASVPLGARWSGWISRTLGEAGLSPHLRASDLLALQLVGAVVFSLLGGAAGGPGLALGFALVGAALPLLWLRDRKKARQLGLVRALPHALDLLTLVVEGGLDLGTALARFVERSRPGPLRDEIEAMLRQLRMGQTRAEALSALRSRVPLAEFAAFATAVIQAERLGTPLGRVLRAQAIQLRNGRTQRAEKLAAEAPVKMLLPLLACIFPTVFLVLLGPIAFALIHGFTGG